MDLAKSILNELVTLQKKNEELIGIITRLEHESDVIIRQFEDKITDLNKNLKKAQDSFAKSGKKYDALVHEKNNDLESFEKEKHELKQEYSAQISEFEKIVNQHIILIEEKNSEILGITEQKNIQEQSFSEISEDLNQKIAALSDQLISDKEKSEADKSALCTTYELVLSNGRDELAKKDRELRTLATDLKNRIADEKRAIKEREKEEIKTGKIIGELRSLLETEHSAYQKQQSESALEIAKGSKSIQNLQKKVDDLEKRNGEIQTSLSSHIEVLLAEKQILSEKTLSDASTIEDLIQENHDLVSLSDQLNSELNGKDAHISHLLSRTESLTFEMESKIAEATRENSRKEQDIGQKDMQISSIRQELSDLQEENKGAVQSFEVAQQALLDEVSELQNQLKEKEGFYKRELSELSTQAEQAVFDLNETVRQKEQREDQFRDEISHLHEEIIRRTGEWKEKVESDARDLAERDRHISLMSGNNEALRAELERVRSRLLMLEKTIREDKEEPVHALYRQIQNLSAKLAEKESENSVLSSRFIRLDTENTRLAQLLGVFGAADQISDNANNESLSESTEKKSTPDLLDISTYLSNLDDPLHAMGAAASILRLGSPVTDTLIPLLYRGALNRRAWIAVLLYELNDPKASKPLSDLLDASESGLRELIWDTRLRFREWRRSGSIPSVVL